MISTLSILLFCAELNGQVVRVIDGDTFIIRTVNRELPIRIQAIDSPERRQNYFHESSQELTSIIGGKNVVIDHRNRYSGKRLVGFVIIDGVDVGTEMVSRGAAWREPRFDRRKRYYHVELNAHESRIGLWQELNPIEPWEWRNQKKNSKN